VTESLHALSGAYVVDALDDDERAAFERHLPRCLDCQHEVASLREAAALMADTAATTPPPDLRDSVLAGIRNIRPLPPETEPRQVAQDEDARDEDAQDEDAEDEEAGGEEAGTERGGRAATTVVAMRSRRRRWAGAVAAAAAVAAVVGGVVWAPWQEETTTQVASPTDRVLQAEDAERVSIDFADGSSATVVRSISEGRAVIITRDMAAPPKGKAYELWLQDDSGTMLPAGLMRTPGDHKLLLEGDAAQATGVGITVEPESGSKEPTGKPIALFDLGEADA
jgi:anti-sigma-K factor RskA